jgi:predicted ATPase/class 3 adenylate cyclase
MAELPTGTVTFLFTDIEGSTRLWEEHPEEMKAALARHDEILRDAVEAHDGHIVKTTGDGVHAAFTTGHDAAGASLRAQAALSAEQWDETGPLRVRMGIHTGEAEVRDGDYYGPALNRAARLMSAAHGGQIVVSHATEELLRDAKSETFTLVDLGEHRLRDLSRAERVFQLSKSDGPVEFPTLRSLDAFPSNLPTQLSSFVGRDDEVAVVAKALDEARVVTITGVGGVGKTRLAIQVAAEVLPRYQDGAWLSELAAADSGDTMLQVVAATFGVNPRAGMTLDASLVDYLRTRALVLVLDNCEHLLDPAGRLAEQIVRDCPDVDIIATSREGLAVEGERVIPLRSLRLPEAENDVATTAANPAVTLFVDRASASGSGFSLDPSNASAVSENCRRLDGIPLAIELAAARAVAMSPGEIAGRLDERFRLLTGGRRTAVERHQTLRATVDWSYSMLGNVEQLVFDRLGVFAGSFSADAASAVTSEDGVEAWDVIDALASLVAKSMIVAETTPDGRTRYSMLETLRQYARERLDQAQGSDIWRRRHAEYCATLAEELGPPLVGPEEIAIRRRCNEDLDNLRAAVTWACDSAAAADHLLASRIVGALHLEAVLHRASGIATWAERVLEVSISAPADLHAKVANAALWGAINRFDLDRARVLGREIKREAGAGSGGLDSLFAALGWLAANDGDGDEVERLYTELTDFHEQVPPHRAVLAMTISNHSMFLAAAGKSSAARLLADEALLAAREVRNPSALTQALYAVGWAWWFDDQQRAVEAFDECIELCRQGASDAVFAGSLGRSGLLHVRAGDVGSGLRDLRDAVLLGRDNGDRISLVFSLDLAAQVAAELSAFEAVATIVGAAESGVVASLNMLSGLELDARRKAFERAEAALGHDIYQRLYARGASLSYEEAIEYALEALDRLIQEADDG